MTAEDGIRAVLSKIDAAWRKRQFDGLDQCFHERAVIVGPGYIEYARGRGACSASYREFASNADVMDYAEDSHRLLCWETMAVYTFVWRMTYRREGGPKEERGTDQLVLQLGPEGWQVVWRYIFFEPAPDAG